MIKGMLPYSSPIEKDRVAEFLLREVEHPLPLNLHSKAILKDPLSNSIMWIFILTPFNLGVLQKSHLQLPQHTIK